MKTIQLLTVLLLSMNLHSQVTIEDVKNDLLETIKEEGDSLILDYDWIYPCFSPVEGSTIEAEVAFEGIVRYLLEHAGWHFEVSSHTDCRGSDKYNLELSRRLAESFRMGLIRKGINPENLSATGYGEAEPINDCLCNEPCTEDQYDENKRYVLKLLSIK